MTMKFTNILKPYSRGKQRWWSRWSQQRQTEGGWALLSPCHLQPANQLRPRNICVLLNFSGDDHDLVVPITVSNISKNPCIGSLERGDKADQVADVRLDCFWTFGLSCEALTTISYLMGRTTSITCPNIRLVKPSPASLVLPDLNNKLFCFNRRTLLS